MNPETRQASASVSLDLLRRYIKAQGWRMITPTPSKQSQMTRFVDQDVVTQTFFQATSNEKPNVDLFTLIEPGSPIIELLIPKNRSGSDFALRMEGAITILSQLEERDPNQVIASIRSLGFDIVRSRIPDSLVVDETIRLEDATSYINGMKNLLAATATTELRPLAFFGRVNKVAAEYSDQCRFGHTYKGSFGFVIESPIVPQLSPTLFGTAGIPPFERRVVQRLAVGIKQVCEAVDTNSLEPLTSGFRDGFGANACERLADLVYTTAYSGLSFAFSFSAEWALPIGLKRNSEMFVGPQHIQAARAAADKLRGESIELPSSVYGAVVRLENEADPSNLAPKTEEGEISVLHSSEEYGDIHLRISLIPSEYLKAVEAHRFGRNISLHGTLVHRGRFWYLRNPSAIIVAPQAELEL